MLIGLLLVPGSAWGQDSVTGRITVDEAVSLALATNRPLKAAGLVAERADREAEALRKRRLPAFDVKGLGGTLLAPLAFDFPMGSLGTYPATGPIPFTDITIESPARPVGLVLFTATQPLTQLRRISLGADALALGGDIAREDARLKRLQLATDVKRVYFGLLQAQAGLDTVKQALGLLEELQRQVGEYVAREAALPADALEVEGRLAETELQRVTIVNQIASLREQLNVLIGRDLDTPVTAVAPPVPPPDLELATAQQRALENRPEIRDADLKATQAGYNVRLKQAAFTPDVSIIGGYLGLYNMEVVPRNTAAIGVYVSWEPFDWGRRRLEREAGNRLAEAAELARVEARARVRADVNARHRRVAEAFAQLRVAEIGERTSAERLRTARERYARDAALLKDVLEAQLGTAQSRQNRLQAEAAYWVARAELQQAVGETAP